MVRAAAAEVVPGSEYEGEEGGEGREKNWRRRRIGFITIDLKEMYVDIQGYLRVEVGAKKGIDYLSSKNFRHKLSLYRYTSCLGTQVPEKTRTYVNNGTVNKSR
jgi:hypothetical protein